MDIKINTLNSETNRLDKSLLNLSKIKPSTIINNENKISQDDNINKFKKNYDNKIDDNIIKKINNLSPIPLVDRNNIKLNNLEQTYLNFNLNDNPKSKETFELSNDKEPDGELSEHEPVAVLEVQEQDINLDKAEPELDEAEPELDEVEQELDEAESELDEAEPELNEAESELDEVEQELDEAEPELDEAEPELDEVEQELDEIEALDEAEPEQKELVEAEQELVEAEQELDDVELELDDAEPELGKIINDISIDENLYKMYLNNTVKELRLIAKLKKVLTKGTKQELITRIINSNI